MRCWRRWLRPGTTTAVRAHSHGSGRTRYFAPGSDLEIYQGQARGRNQEILERLYSRSTITVYGLGKPNHRGPRWRGAGGGRRCDLLRNDRAGDAFDVWLSGIEVG